ncbi:4'-phosphopantetheinyl transferase superfamily protein [Bacillus mycoides]|uniref:4'-phosphopantetheinyl transferase family protein n=1 Tax=Bacillus cereus group TaxID=86661 RepID=UPI0006DA63E5|nr:MULTISPECIES: 4'-phosphopantetheinyl transferase superfamily protein [Bacillus cereus group]KPU56776.1 4'-phosphopantetheinyl transferase superfamily protein [Bacillus wiedmannii]QWG48861.1 4'-phosphopantetheinyl transferase superfamily protein [Bacillus mycoides]QWH32667.1 4'-phosphopantetheinyl transferase superfamily protein [Bacillus mycoides]
MVKIYAVKIPDDFSEEEINRISLKISSSKRVEINKKIEKMDRLRSICGYLLLKYVFKKNLNMDFEMVKLKRNAYGKPYFFSEDLNWQGDFNISHSGKWVVLAFTKCGEIGIDIEEVKPFTPSELEDMSHFIFTVEEREVFFRGFYELQLDNFYNRWVLLESYLKMTGEGFYNYIPNSFQGVEKGYYQKFLDLEDGYKLSVCTMKKELINNIYLIEISELIN